MWPLRGPPLPWTIHRKYTGVRRVFVGVAPRRVKSGPGQLPFYLPFGVAPGSARFAEGWVLWPPRKATSKRSGKSNANGANLGFEQTLWLAADKLHNNRSQLIA